MNRLIKIFFILASVLYSVPALSQGRIQVEAPTMVDISDQYFQVVFTIENAEVRDFTPPSFSGFSVVAGPHRSQSTSIRSINGKTTRSSWNAYTITLTPTKKGEFSIGAATALLDGKKVSSAPFKIKVVGSGEKRQNGQGSRADARQAAEMSGKDLFITATANPSKVYEQQPVLLSYKTYSRRGIQLSQIALNTKPDFKGMISQDVPNHGIYQHAEEVKGEMYASAVVQQYVLFPQAPGKIKVPSVVFDCDVLRPDSYIDPFEAFMNGGGSMLETVKLKSKDIELQVLPLPTPKPADFSGGVGQFSIKGELLSDEIATNDVATYRVTVEGTGNLKLLNKPDFSLSGDFDVYNPKVQDKTEVTESGVRGQMIYDYTFVPRKVGDYEIPALVLTYFDPVSESYKSDSTKVMKIHVNKGNKSDEEYQRSINLQKSDIRDLHVTDTQLVRPDDAFWWGSWWYWLLYAALVIMTLIVFSVIKHYIHVNADVVSRKRRKAGKMAVRKMKKAKSFMQANQRGEFYTEVSRALYGYIANKYNIGTADLNRSRIETELTEMGVEESVVQSFIKIIDECDFAQYAPSDQVMNMKEMYDVAVNTIVDIENQKNVTKK